MMTNLPLKNEKGIEDAALAQIAAMFQRPSQLEKLDELRKRAERKKATADAMLRASVQSALEGIRSSVNHLQAASENVKHIGESLENIFTLLQHVPETKVKLSKLSQANHFHSQYATAMNNVNHIFNFNETVEKTNQFIMDGKLLSAHWNIMELENARDDLMFVVHKYPSDKQDYDINLLKKYFGEVEGLVQDLAKQIWYICSRAIEVVHGQDDALQQLVSAIRIIEREERIDHYYEDTKSNSKNFIPPGRPRRWRKKLFEILQKNVQDRLEGQQLEDRAINTHWLVRYLEAVRRKVVEDLKIAKNCLVSCFPPEYTIYDRYIKYYHDAISSLLKDVASNELEKNELVQLLGWIQAYPGENMLGTPLLMIQAQNMVQENPLLPKALINQLCDRYINLTKTDISNWSNSALSKEKDDWYNNEIPDIDSNRCYYTSLPTILFAMIEDIVILSKEVTTEIVPRVVEVAIDEFLMFSTNYKDAATAFKKKHFEDRSYFQQFTKTMVAIANNFGICIENTDRLKKHIRITMETSDTDLECHSARSVGFGHVNRQELIEKIETLKRKWNIGMQFALAALLEELFHDINKHTEKLLSRIWLLGSGTNDLETICVTVSDYHNDYIHLRSNIRYLLLKEILYKVIGEYLIAIDLKRLSFSKYDERHLAAERIKYDAKRIEGLFKPLFEHIVDITMPVITQVLPALAEILDLRDKSLLTLEASTFVRKYPDIPVELLTSIIQIREDTSKTEAKAIAEEAINNVRYHPKGDQTMIRLFSMCKSGSGKRALPALETTVQNMFATLKATVPHPNPLQ